MRTLFLKTFIMVTILVPWIAYADTQSDDAFKTGCLKAWMERADKSSDKVNFQNFGEKYCNCAASKSLANDSDITKAAKTCMSQTLLHDAMDALEEDPGLKNLTQDKIQSGCAAEWKIINPDMNAEANQQFNAYCQCAASKLMDLNNDRENLTDKQWADKINSIADTCSSKIVVEKTANKS